MVRTLITVKSDLFDDPNGEEASIREHLPVRVLISEIRKEFNLSEDNYVLRDEETGETLDPDKTLEQQNIKTGRALQFSRERRAQQNKQQGGMFNTITNEDKLPLTGLRASLQDLKTGQVFDIRYRTCLIGRSSQHDPDSARQLDVNVATLPDARTVSRHHARISEFNRQFFVETIPEIDRNKTLLNDSVVRPGERRVLQPGDVIQVGQVELQFNVK